MADIGLVEVEEHVCCELDSNLRIGLLHLVHNLPADILDLEDEMQDPHPGIRWRFRNFRAHPACTITHEPINPTHARRKINAGLVVSG